MPRAHRGGHPARDARSGARAPSRASPRTDREAPAPTGRLPRPLVLAVRALGYGATFAVLYLVAASDLAVEHALGSLLVVLATSAVFDRRGPLGVYLSITVATASLVVLSVDAPSASPQVYVGQLAVMGGLAFLIVGSRIRTRMELERSEQRYAVDALHDALTSLPNRTLFLDRLDTLLRSADRRPERSFAVLFMDLDDFKLVNDSLGHPAGDELLVQIARRVETAVRRGDTVARLGGDEFAVLLDGVRGAGEVLHAVQRIHAQLTMPFHVAGRETYATACIGIVMGEGRYGDPEVLLRDADTAMYRAKDRGRSSYEVFDDGMHREAVARLAIENDLRRALEREEFLVHYQPLVAFQDGRLVGLEALVRWAHPLHGLVAPDAFINVAEEAGLIVPLGEWVLWEACSRLAAIRGEHARARDVFVSVNLSALQFLQPDLAGSIAGVLEGTRLPARSLKLEITESVIMRNPEQARQALDRLKRMGVRVSVDDFGTGHSSLSYLNTYPVDVLKIDRSFIRGVDDAGMNLTLVASIVSLARSLGLAAVAEGVETAEQLRTLRSMGCDYAQGFLLAEPMEGDALLRELREGVLPGPPAQWTEWFLEATEPARKFA